MNPTIAIIPARYASVRFEGKPLADVRGKPMIQRVYEQVIKAVEDVVVATDDKRIFHRVKSFNGRVVMTSPSHTNGTERCREALQLVEENSGKKYEYILNVQGDEPFINPKQIKILLDVIQKNKSCNIATLIKKIDSQEVLTSSNVVKVVKSMQNKALYFSRATIPFVPSMMEETSLKNSNFYRHIGIYAFRSDTLKEIVELPATQLEKIESLEQLRWLANGYSIDVTETTLDTLGIDTPEDLKKYG